MYVANLSFDGLYKQIYLARQQNWKKGSKHKLILLMLDTLCKNS